jgi:hypothetical protein
MTPNPEETNEERGARHLKSDQRIGAFVTNKWLIGLLVALVMSMGGYIFKGIDKGNDVQASEIAALKEASAKHDVEIATIQTTIALNYGEFVRRLEKIEQQNDRIERHVVSAPRIASPQPAAPDTRFDRPAPPGVWPNCRTTQNSVRAANGEWFCQNR